MAIADIVVMGLTLAAMIYFAVLTWNSWQAWRRKWPLTNQTKRPLQDWTVGHVTATLAAVAVCGILYVYTGDADVFFAMGAILGAGALAVLAAELQFCWTRRREG